MIRILLAEDDTSMREYLQRALTRVGYEVEAVGCGTEAMPLLEAGRYDLLLTDMRMPYMNGADLARELRTRKSDLKLICISGYPGSLATSVTSAIFTGVRMFCRA